MVLKWLIFNRNPWGAPLCQQTFVQERVKQCDLFRLETSLQSLLAALSLFQLLSYFWRYADKVWQTTFSGCWDSSDFVYEENKFQCIPYFWQQQTFVHQAYLQTYVCISLCCFCFFTSAVLELHLLFVRVLLGFNVSTVPEKQVDRWIKNHTKTSCTYQLSALDQARVNSY